MAGPRTVQPSYITRYDALARATKARQVSCAFFNVGVPCQMWWVAANPATLVLS